jgi:methyltransferase
MELGFGWPQAIVLLVAAQRVAELVLARRNTARLLAGGGVEHGASHYPLFVALHTGWLVALFFTVSADRAPVWPLIAVAVLLQAGRYWVIRTLGPYWTTRIITLPEAPLVTGGPFRWVRHPNYVIVTLEIALLPLAFGAVGVSVLFSLLNAGLLAWRISIEERVLLPRRGGFASALQAGEPPP